MKVHYEIYRSPDDEEPIAWFVYYPDVVPRIGESVYFGDMPDGWEKMGDELIGIDLKVWDVQHMHAEGNIDIIVYLHLP